MSFSEPALETEARPASLVSHLGHALNQWTGYSVSAQAGQTAPSWALRDVMYNRVMGNKQLSGEVIAMVFCATWCVPCAWEVETWRDLQKTYGKDKFKVVGIFLDFNRSIPPFVLQHNIQAAYHCCPATEKIKWDYNVNPTGRIPFLALIDRRGILNGTWIGYHSKTSYESAIKTLL